MKYVIHTGSLRKFGRSQFQEGREVHPSKTLYYLITTWCKKPKNDHHENTKPYCLHSHHYAPGGTWQPMWHGDWLYAEQSGVQIPVGMWRFVAIWTSPKAHPVSSTQGTGSFLRVKQPGYGADHPTHPSTSTPLLYLHRMIQGKLNCVMHSAILKWSLQTSENVISQ
jgi:hypothetical protein